jgi:hypothetical protein
MGCYLPLENISVRIGPTSVLISKVKGDKLRFETRLPNIKKENMEARKG